ncbi:hypothetical protein Tco_1470566 [Tanacetum coccineum]
MTSRPQLLIPLRSKFEGVTDWYPEPSVMPCSDFPAISLDESIESPILLVILSDTESDPSEDSPSSDHALVSPSVSPFLFDDRFESEPLEDSFEDDAPEPHEAIVARWRAAVMEHSLSSSSSASTPPASFQLVPASPSLPRRPTILV